MIRAAFLASTVIFLAGAAFAGNPSSSGHAAPSNGGMSSAPRAGVGVAGGDIDLPDPWLHHHPASHYAGTPAGPMREHGSRRGAMGAFEIVPH